MELKIKIPNRVNEITLGQYQKYVELITKHEQVKIPNEQLKMELISIMCYIPVDLIKITMTAKEINDISNILVPLVHQLSLNPIESLSYKFNPMFKVQRTRFGFIPDLENMKAGEFADLSLYIVDVKNAHKAMAVMYRPVTKIKRNRFLKIHQYQIKEYDGTSEYSEIMKVMPAIKYIEASFFLINSFFELRKCILTSTVESLKEMETTDSVPKVNLEISGVGTKVFTALETILY